MRFTSARERRLWRWTAVAILAVVLGLVFARALVGLIPEPVQVALFASSLIVVPAAIILQVLRARPRGLELGVGLAVALAYVLLLVRVASPIERSHVIEYSGVALLMYEALRERAKHRRLRFPPGPTAFVLTAGLGVLDEVVQIWIPDRVFDLQDIAFNVLAALAAVTGAAATRWARRVTHGRRRTAP